MGCARCFWESTAALLHYSLRIADLANRIQGAAASVRDARCRGSVVRALNPRHHENCSRLQQVAAFEKGSRTLPPRGSSYSAEFTARENNEKKWHSLAL